MNTPAPASSHSSLPDPITWSPEEILLDYETCVRSRLASNAMRRETLSGKAKFGIEGGGKELPQVALARYFRKGDFYSGYYRDQTFLLRKGLATVEDLFASLYADAVNDKFSGGRQMNNHGATALVDEDGNWLDHTERYNIVSGLAPLGGNITHALGIALASKKFRELPDLQQADQFSVNGNEISICTVGDATTSEGVFFEALNAAGVMQIPFVYVIYDDGHGISVPTKYQTTKGSISEVLEGFRYNEEQGGVYLYTAKASDYEGMCAAFEEGLEKVRENHIPAVFHIQDCTQPNGHSTSGSHERYKTAERLQWEKDADPILAFEKWIIEQGFATIEELEERKAAIEKEVKASIKKAWQDYISPVNQEIKQVKGIYQRILTQLGQDPEVQAIITELDNAFYPVMADLLKNVDQMRMYTLGMELPAVAELTAWHAQAQRLISKRYNTHLHSQSAQSALNVPHIPATYTDESPMVNGFEVLNRNFEQLFQTYDKLFAFGEDLGKIGGVNQAMAGLQAKFGEERIFDTGIREWTIVAQAIGMGMRGLRPIAEVQYLDYIHYALSPLADDLATLRYRTNGMQKSPAIIRTRGHRLEGIWHSGSPIAMLLHSMRGIHILVPRNMTQAAGMYNTLLRSDDPALMIEVLNGYRQKELLPSNLGTFTVPLGMPEILQEGTDVTLVTYGACVRVAQEALEPLARKGISVELIDVQTLLPFDLDHLILESLQKTNRIVFLDEDVPGGASAYMMQQVLEEQGGYQFLDSQPLTLTATPTRPPYGNDGDYYAKPQPMDVFRGIYELMQEVAPQRFKGSFPASNPTF